MTLQQQYDYPGWLVLQQYAEKYGLEIGTLRGWLRVGKEYLEAEKKPYKHHTHGETLAWFIRDKPPEEHPQYVERYPKYKNTPYKASSIYQRKMVIKGYVQIFLECSNPAKERFTRSELAVVLSVPTSQIKTWEVWGLPKTTFNGNKSVWQYGWYYARQDILDFLNGDWDKLKQKIGGIVDEGEAAKTAATQATEEGYYVYQKDKVYPRGYDGFIAWLKDKEIKREEKRQEKWITIRPEDLLPQEKEYFYNALKLRPNGDFQYQDVCTSRPRGEVKSHDVKLLFLYRFFNFFRETILCASNSKEQASFIQFDEATKTIQHTEKLRNTPGLVIQKKDIVLYEGSGKEFSKIVPIAAGQGLLPNITCVVFTEICNLRDESFYSQLSGSVRSIPNAMVLIDSTVAPKGHPFWRLYQAFLDGDPLVYFQHYEDQYFNPETTPEYLASKKRTMLATEYAKYFRNRWEDATDGVFPADSILEMGFAGIKGRGIGPSDEMTEKIKELSEQNAKLRNPLTEKGNLTIIRNRIVNIKEKLDAVDDYYRMPATSNDLMKISNVLKCDFILGVGIDRANTLAVHDDRTCMALTARAVLAPDMSFYFMLDMYLSKKTATLDVLTAKIMEWNAEFGFLDKIVVESYQGQDLYNWCVESAFEAELVHPSYKVQKMIFSLYCMIVKMGWYKCPAVPYWADTDGNLHEGYQSVKDDLLREEMAAFKHSEEWKWFGTEEKNTKGGVKDDSIYGGALSIYATHGEEMIAGRRPGKSEYPDPVVNTDVLGDYA